MKKHIFLFVSAAIVVFAVVVTTAPGGWSFLRARGATTETCDFSAGCDPGAFTDLTATPGTINPGDTVTISGGVTGAQLMDTDCPTTAPAPDQPALQQRRYRAFGAFNASYSLDGGAAQGFSLQLVTQGTSDFTCHPFSFLRTDQPYTYSFSIPITNTSGLSAGTHTVTVAATSPNSAQFIDMQHQQGAQFTGSVTFTVSGQKTATLDVSQTNFNFTKNEVTVGSGQVANIGDIGSGMTVSSFGPAWLNLTFPTSTLTAGQPSSAQDAASQTFSIEVSTSTSGPTAPPSAPGTYPATVSVSASVASTARGGIINTANAAGGTGQVTGSPKTISVNYTVPPTTLTCSPTTSTAQVNTLTGFSANGGVAPYTWSAAAGGSPATGSGPSFKTQFANPGDTSVLLTDARGQTATCNVTVSQIIPLCSATFPSQTCFHVGDTVSYSVTSNPSGYPSYDHRVFNGQASVILDPGSPTSYSVSYTLRPGDVGTYNSQYFTIGPDPNHPLCTTNSWGTVTVVPVGAQCGSPGPGGPGPSGYPQLQIYPTSASLNVGDTTSFSAFYLDNSSGNIVSTDVTSAASWRSSDNSVLGATSLAGSFIGNSAGGATVTTSYSGLSANAAVTVGGRGTPFGCTPQGQCARGGRGASCNSTADCGGGGGSTSCNNSGLCVLGGTGRSCAVDTDCTGGPGANDFTLNVTPTTRNINSGDTTTYTVRSGEVGNFTSPIGLVASGLPSGATMTFSPVSVTPGNTATLTVRTPSGMAAGNYTVTVTGQASLSLFTTVTHTTTANLNVSCPKGQMCGGPGNNGPSGSPPISCTFSASPQVVYRSNPWTTLNWSCSNATSCSISSDIPGGNLGSVGTAGERRLQVATTTTYILGCVNADQSQQYSAPTTVRILNIGETNPGG